MLRLSICFGKRVNGKIVVRNLSDRVFSRPPLISNITCQESQIKTQISSKIPACFMSQNHQISNDRNWNLVYEGPLSKSVKYVKTFSLTTAAASLIGSPILVYFGKQSVPLVGKLAIASLLCLVGTSTTVLLHWFSKGYVHQLYYNSTRQVFSAETLSFFGRKQTTEFKVEEIVFPEVESAFSTFEVNGKKFFIHQEMVEAQQILHFVRESKIGI